MKFEMNLKIEKPRYFTVSDITYAQVDAWFGHTTRDLKLDLIYPKLKNKKYPCIVWFCGGGWIRLDKSAHFAYLAKLALEGALQLQVLNIAQAMKGHIRCRWRM